MITEIRLMAVERLAELVEESILEQSNAEVEYEQPIHPAYKRIPVKCTVMKSQVIKRKPFCVRARTAC